MTNWISKREINTVFRGLHTIRYPAGIPVLRVDGPGGGFALDPEACETTSPKGPLTIWAHDTAHYYIWINPEDVEPVVA